MELTFRRVMLLLLIAVISGKTNGANILGLMGTASPSHHIWNSVLMHELAARGHNVTILSVDIPKKSETIPKNVHYIHLEKVYSNLYSSDVPMNITDFISTSLITSVTSFFEFCHNNGKAVWESNGHEILRNYPDNFKFDLIIYDYTCGGALLPYVHKFNYPPLIGVSAFLNPPSTLDLVGGHIYPGYVPFSSSRFDRQMSFSERLINTAMYYSDFILRRYSFAPKLDSLVRSYWQENIPSLTDLEQRTVLALVNSHPAVNHPQPVPPNVIEVGGLQLVDAKPLPTDIESFVNGAKKGAIFVSLGTNMKYEDLGPTRAKIFLDAMSQLPEYNFLWKSDMKPEFEIPKNVLIKPFFPQRDLLGHKNLKAFVTHAGGLSTQEAVWYGVPMIGIPLFVDQHGNLHRSMTLGVAEKIEFNDLSVKILRDTILKVTEDPKYTKNMKLYSRRYRDRPMRALDTAVWWIEYVLRNPEPTHLRSPTIKLGFMCSNSLDVIFFISVIIIASVWLLYLSLKCCFCSRKQSSQKKNVNFNKKNK